MAACGSSSKKAGEELQLWADAESPAAGDVASNAYLGDFNVDTAFNYVAKQVAFGPRVPNSRAHKEAGDWIVQELKKNGVSVIEQPARLKAFDGTVLNARNIFGRINPEVKDRLLLVAHWDCRPWADQDPDPDKRTLPVDGANDAASGVAVLLEIARQLSLNPTTAGIDLLFVDAEDWGEEGNDDSWALGTQYFVENPPVKGYAPRAAILLDMVGGKDAVFCREYFSERSAPDLADKIWSLGKSLGYDKFFVNKMGSAILDDHVQLIKAGIPAIDIIEYHTDGESGFNSRWHTTADNLDGISAETLGAVGNTLLKFIRLQ